MINRYVVCTTESIEVAGQPSRFNFRIVSGLTESIAITETHAGISPRTVLAASEAIEFSGSNSFILKAERQVICTPATLFTHVVNVPDGNPLSRQPYATLITRESNADVVIASQFVTQWGTIVQAMIVDSAEASDTVTQDPQTNILDVAEASDIVTDPSFPFQAILDSAEAQDFAPNLIVQYIVDSVEVNDLVTSKIIELILDTVNASDTSVAPVLLDAIIDTAIAGDTSANDRADFILDAVDASDTVNDSIGVRELIVDSAEAADLVTQLGTLIQVISDVAEASDSAIPSPSTIIELLLDTCIARDVLYSANPQAIAWVVNTETGAPWFYTNFDYNSITFHSGMLFAGAQDGLYLLEGADDAGNNIVSEVQTGFVDFDNPYKKRLPNIYFGYTGGELECDIEVFDQPNDIYTYNLEEREASAPRNTRLQTGKGLVGRWWRFTLRNVNGTDFNMHDHSADVVSSKRRL